MKLLMVCIFLAGCNMVSAQTKTTEHVNQLWVGYLNQTRISNKFGIWADFHLRTKEEFTNSFSTSILRLGLTYYVTDNTKLTAGLAYVSLYPAAPHNNITRPELRPWQQVQWHTKYGKKRMMQYIRLEERYRRKVLNESTLADGYNFNFRLRYNIFYDIPLTKKGIVPNSFSFFVNDEVHVNFGKEIISNYYDQNRFFVGFKYQATDLLNFQLGYMNLFQQLNATRYRNINAVRLAVFQNFDLRKK